MSVRRLDPKQPASFAFSPENLAWAIRKIADYPQGKQASAVIPLLWRAQEQHEGWLPEPAMRRPNRNGLSLSSDAGGTTPGRPPVAPVAAELDVLHPHRPTAESPPRPGSEMPAISFLNHPWDQWQ